FFFSSRRRHTIFSRDWSSDVCSSDLRRACKQVMANKGSAGVDGMSVKELPCFLKSNEKDLCGQVRSNRYFAQAIQGVEIPKENRSEERRVGKDMKTPRTRENQVEHSD